MTEGDVPLILALGGLLLLSAFFSGSETALIASRRLRLEALAEKGNKTAIAVLKLLENPGSLLGTILVGNNLVNVAAAAIATSLLGPAKATIVATLLLLIVGEIPPKTMAAMWPERISRVIVYPIMLAKFILAPFVLVTTFITDLLLLPFTRKLGKKPRFYSREELQMALDRSRESGELEPGEAQMAQEILDLPEVKLHEIMIPENEAARIERDWSLERVLEELRRRRFTRYPVYTPGTRYPTGILHVKDLLISGHKNRWQSLIRPLPFRNLDMDADDLLRDMQIARYHMAAVVDDDMQVVGFVTMERILEEIVGEIADEHDLEADPVVRTLDSGIYRVRGDLEIADVERILNVDFAIDNDELTVKELYNSLKGEAASTSDVRIGPALLRPGRQGYLVQLLEKNGSETSA